jgi:uncharacterized membrane protein
MRTSDIALVVLGVFGSTATIVALALDRPLVALPLVLLLVAVLCAILARRWIFPYYEVRRALSSIMQEIRNDNFRPSYVFAFNR